MARFALVQNLLTENLGIMSISAYLQREGHECRIFIDVQGTDAFPEVEAYRPQVLGFTATTGMHHWALDFARRYKERHPDVVVILGGPHATFHPWVIEDPVLDYVCVGEGEGAATDLGRALAGDGDPTQIPNLWMKRNGQIIQNPVRPLIQDLDALPFADRSYYDRYPVTARETSKNFMSGRGCAYKCNFCANHMLQELYRDKGKYVRFRSQENVIEEIKMVKAKYPMRFVGFSDDTLIMSRKWLYPFLEMYKKEIGLPFLSTVRANLVDDELVVRLKDAGCISCVFGLESGVERIRNEVLAKGVKDRDIYRAAEVFKRQGMRFGTYNMFGLPGETIEDAFETVKMNARIKTDYPLGCILQPYPGTKIRKLVEQEVGQELPIDEIGGSFFKSSVVRNKKMRQMENLQKLLHVAVKFPFLIPVIRQAIKLPPNFMYELIFQACYGWQLMQRSRISPFKLIQYGIASQRLFKKQKKADKPSGREKLSPAA
ncbi:MAG TPA: radical SAM protein [bacterium]|jgi:radical SAM superfamily enzyme YgiQ (UPF0313 family)